MAVQQSIVREAQNVIGQLLAPGLEDPYPLYAWLRENGFAATQIAMVPERRPARVREAVPAGAWSPGGL